MREDEFRMLAFCSPTRVSVVALALAFSGCDVPAPSGGDTCSPCGDWSGNPDDLDGDGYDPGEGDCAEGDPDINPGATEYCDGIDNNCWRGIDDGLYLDADGDGVGAAGDVACIPGLPAATNTDDCNDADAAILPGAVEGCDGVDNDCDGEIDEQACALR